MKEEGGRKRKMEEVRTQSRKQEKERESVSGSQNEGVLSDSEHTVDESFERSRKLRSISAVRACSTLRDSRG